MQTNENAQLIVVLGGCIVKGENGRWRTTKFEEQNPSDAFGDRLRVVAAAMLYYDWTPKRGEVIVLASGSRGALAHIPAVPTVASVISAELRELGVPDKAIRLDEVSGTTFDQLFAFNQFSRKSQFAAVAVISNRYHLSRIRAMIETAPPLALLKELLSRGALELISAEEVCLAHDKAAWEDVITRAYASKAMAKIKANEARGVEDIRRGRYRFS